MRKEVIGYGRKAEQLYRLHEASNRGEHVMQKQIYETPDLIVFGNIEAITAGQSQFSLRGDHRDYDGSKVTYPKPPNDDPSCDPYPTFHHFWH